ncbi:transposase [Sorangium sp. So ce1128]
MTGGGLCPDGARWLPARRRYLFPIEVMGALFRGKLLAALDTAIARGEVEMPGDEAADPEAWDHLRDRLHRMRWNVYAKRPFGGAEQVIRYLGRYTHRVGISNHRLVRPPSKRTITRPRTHARAPAAPGARSRNRLLIMSTATGASRRGADPGTR